MKSADMPLCFCGIRRNKNVNKVFKNFASWCLDNAWGIKIVDGTENCYFEKLFSGVYIAFPFFILLS